MFVLIITALNFFKTHFDTISCHISVFFPSLDKFLSSLKAIDFKSNIKIAILSKVFNKYTLLFIKASLDIMEKVETISTSNTDNFRDGLSEDK